MQKELLDKTIARFQAFEPKEEGYYGAFSGGKDSQVLYHVAKMANVKVDWHFNVTTIDPPQLLRFIRQNYPDVEWERPSMTMFQLIEKKGMLPTRIARFCCQELKDGGGKGRKVLLGVRAEESFKRSQYTMVKVCQKNHRHLIRPLLDWRWNDVWQFLNEQNISHCELYDPPYNFKRIGCIGCPMAGKKVWREFRFFPNHKRAYLNTIRKLMNMGKFQEFDSPETYMRWWISGNNKQSFLAAETQQSFCFD